MTDTAELRRLLAAATPAPWWAIQNECDAVDPRQPDTKRSIVTARFVEDAALIAAMRNELPAILAALEGSQE